VWGSYRSVDTTPVIASRGKGQVKGIQDWDRRGDIGGKGYEINEKAGNGGVCVRG